MTSFLLRLYLKSPQLARKISLLTPAIEGSLVRRLKPKDLRVSLIFSLALYFKTTLGKFQMYSAIIYAAPYWYYLKNRDLYCYPVIWYHELITDTSRTLTQLFMVVSFPFHLIDYALFRSTSPSFVFKKRWNVKMKTPSRTRSFREKI